jgi:phosphatidylinositol glycan class O
MDETVDSATTRLGGSRSKLIKFVADPPTVTMQRLKGLTTGGLPAFADISNSFGGATVDEDTWIVQLKDAIHRRRNNENNTGGSSTYMAFVGDDTWVDLFPNLFHDCHPFPSFNTRDLDTVDNGCLQHIPRLFNHFGPYDKDKQLLKSLNHIARYDSKKHLKEKENDTNYYTASTSAVQQLSEKDYFELIVVHFLGVDHVGHTYGPNNIHMIEKLSQMDEALTEILKRIDSAVNTCEVAFILGDHGMTKDGNHGGGTEDETNAGLFAHFSPGCSDVSVRN